MPQFRPADLELIGRRHVGHRTAGGQIRKDDLLVRHREDVRALGHEVHAAEHDVIGARMLGDCVGELERVAGVIRELDDFVALVVMAQDHEAFAEGGARRRNAQRHLVVRQTEVRLWERLPLTNRCLLDFVQDG